MKTPLLREKRKDDTYEKAKSPVDEWNREHTNWVLVNTASTSVICFLVNFGFATLTFKDADPPSLLGWPTPLLGNFAVTIGLEISLNWLISNTFMTLDVLNGKVSPINPKALRNWPAAQKWMWWLKTTEMQIGGESRLVNFVQHFVRVLPWIFISFLLLFPSFSGAAYLIWGENGYNSFPIPEILTGTLGILIVLVTIPFWAVITLASIGSQMDAEIAGRQPL